MKCCTLGCIFVPSRWDYHAHNVSACRSGFLIRSAVADIAALRGDILMRVESSSERLESNARRNGGSARATFEWGVPGVDGGLACDLTSMRLIGG